MPAIPTDGKSRRTPRALSALLKAWWRRRVPFLISLGLTTFALFIYSYTFVGDRPTAIFSFINRLELNALDFRFRVRPDNYKHPDSRIIIVDIDQRSQEVLGRWPFSRTHFAEMHTRHPGRRCARSGRTHRDVFARTRLLPRATLAGCANYF